MEIRYKFEGSSEVRELTTKTGLSDEDICVEILKSIFGASLPPCSLSIKNRENGIITLERVYVMKFKKVEIKKKPKNKRRRRWESPPPRPRRKRWVSRSPDRYMNRYNRVYTNGYYI